MAFVALQKFFSARLLSILTISHLRGANVTLLQA